MMVIRRAEKFDAGRCLELGEQFLRESVYCDVLAPQAGSLERFVDAVLEYGETFVCEVVPSICKTGYKPGLTLAGVRMCETCAGTPVQHRIVGMLAGGCGAHEMTGQLVAIEAAWYVQPEYRSGRCGPLLLKAFEAWAIAEGAEVLKMLAPVGSDNVGKFYERMGFRALETAYIKTLKKAG